MFLSRLSLDPRSARARRDLADPYDMHRTLARVFASGDEDAVPRFLWRLEPTAVWHDPVLLVQSGVAGDWAQLGDRSNYLRRPVETKEIDPRQLLVSGARYRFRLHANPTVTRSGKRHGLASEDAQLQWLARQGENSGFRVENCLVIGSDMLILRKGEAQISLLRACFEGVLSVTNAELAEQALVSGVGPGKAFGCGLLSVARG